MARLGLEREVVDSNVHKNSVERFREAGIVLPTFRELAHPNEIPETVVSQLANVDRNTPHPLNLFRIHWYNTVGRTDFAKFPDCLVLPSELTGIPAKIVVLLGNRFPMIDAHKVLASYGCLAPRIITGQFDPTKHKAIWPSTGNYCRGGVAVSRILQSHGVAVLPEGMSQERFDWLADWVLSPDDVIKTPGSESNVKEIYDKCAELDQDPDNVIFNQFSEFGNYLAHYLCTGSAIQKVFEALERQNPHYRPRAYVSASGSAGTLGAGDYLKENFGTSIVVSEALECPTLLYNGFGEHNIQGIGDKHVPFIHNVMNTDLVVAIPERSTDMLNVLFNTETGKAYLEKRKNISEKVLDKLPSLGLSSICNILTSIKTAKYYDFDENDLIFTIATDGAAMYKTEQTKALSKYFHGEFDMTSAGETYGEHISAQSTAHVRELSWEEKKRIFNLGYFTWVEQQGVPIDAFVERQNKSFWMKLHDLIPVWDEMIEEFNRKTGIWDSK